MVLHRTKVKEFHPWVEGNHICPLSSLPLCRHCEERLRRGNPGPHAKTSVHVTLDCRAESGSQ